ncbi:MAG: acetyl-CoA carboxylase biotin carboxyl carrier protein [Alphaproteobacteria bacterium]|nr:acetyl-CoA carboxylase biotin carboxyl carrier protein [Alphaproteobacteria bacterium]
MDLTEEDVLEILKLIEQSDFEYFRLQSGDLNLTVSKGGYVPSAAQAPPQPQEPLPRAAPQEEQRAVANPCSAEPAPVPEEVADREGLVAILAPMVGTFYRAPEPGADPFVEVGDKVDSETTVGLVEVMKVFTSIPAGVAGTVTEVVAANAQFVEKGEVLYYITPVDAAR